MAPVPVVPVASALVFVITGCGGGNKPTPVPSPTPIPTPSPTPSDDADVIYKKVLTENEAWMWGARALDGSPYAYYTSASNASGPLDWIIYLDGGGECEEYSDCIERISYQGSSKNLSDTISARQVSDGMTSKDPKLNPDFYNWGTLNLPYLSGDDWIGTQAVACVPWGSDQNCSEPGNTTKRPLFFTGHNNFEAGIKHWLQGLSFRPRNVLLTGGSAGGQGAFFHADRLAEMLPGVNVKANPQYGWFGQPTDTFPDWKKGKHTPSSIPYPSSGSPIAVPPWMYNITSFIPKNCLDTLAVKDSRFLCTALPRVALTIAVPLFVSTNLFDGWLTSEMENVSTDHPGLSVTGDQRVTYMLSVTAPSQRSSVKAATKDMPRKSNGAFVPACFEHPMEWNQGMQNYAAPVLGDRGCTHGEAVASWFFERFDCDRYLIDEENNPRELATMGCNGGIFVNTTFIV